MSNGRLTTHVLDVSRGKPASGLRLTLFHINEEGGREALIEASTNADGRIDMPLLAEASMLTGIYELVFEAGDYFRRLGGDDTLVFDQIPVRFTITDSDAHYHIPLLAAPGGYSTYRGS